MTVIILLLLLIFSSGSERPLFSVTQEVLSLRQQLSDSQLTAKEKEKLIEKAAELAAENVGLRAAADEAHGQRIALEDRIKVMQEELLQRFEEKRRRKCHFTDDCV